MKILGVGKTRGYEIIHTLNEELRQKGYMTKPGRVSVTYFKERFYIIDD